MTSVQNVGNLKTQPPVIVENVPVQAKRLSFKADKNDTFVRSQKQPVYTDVPVYDQQAMLRQAIEKQEKEQKRQKITRGVVTGITAAASLMMLIYFGKEMHAKRLAEKEKARLSQMLGGEGSNIQELINNCKDPKIKRLIIDEYSKGHGASEKKIRALSTLANIKRGQTQKVELSAIDKTLEGYRKILDDEVIGMEEAKDQVIDYFRYRLVCIAEGKNPGPFVLALDGPPGTAKTTLAKAIGKISNMPCKEISMAGMTGKAPLKGSESVYSGATWGEFANAQIEHERKDICYILDEIEKFGKSEHNGKPDDVLLSALDDRHAILDDFLGCDIDLSDSIIITTSNDIGKINEILRSRLGTPVTIEPYTEAIKKAVTEFKAGRCIKEHNISETVKIADDAIEEIVKRNASSQGGREVTAEIEQVIKKVYANERLTATKEKPFVITADTVRRYLPKQASAPAA